MSRRVLARVLVLVLIGGLVASACGPGAQKHAQRLDAHSAPTGLLETTTSVPAGGARQVFLVYFLAAEGVVPVVRHASTDAPSPAALRALAAGPTPDEVVAGIHSDIPPDTHLSLRRVHDGVADVDLDPVLLSAGPDEQVGALAQIVYTVTAQPGIRSVRFLVDGKAVEVPAADQVIVNRPVGRSDYATITTKSPRTAPAS
jgi:spore germination protein GerM